MLMPLWLQKEKSKYKLRREDDKRVDMTYLTSQQREKHICHTWEGTDSYIQRHLAKADAKQGDEKYVLIIDTEETLMQNGRRFNCHERELLRKGAKKEEIDGRWRNSVSLRKGSDRKGADRRVSGYWRHREEDRLDGITNATVAAISIASADDKAGLDTFAIHIGNLLGKNKVEIPPSFLKLVSHHAVVLVNVGEYEDINAFVTTFYDDIIYKKEVSNIKYIDAQEFFLKTWGEGWNGKDKDGKSRSTNGILNILEYANPGFTMLKEPETTNSNWLTSRWSIVQTRYVLEDVQFLSLAVGRVLAEEGDSFMDSLIYRFPERKLGKSATKGPYYGPSSTDISRRTDLLGFSSTLSSSDEDQEPGHRYPASGYDQRREEERKNAAAYTAAAASTSASTKIAPTATHLVEESSASEATASAVAPTTEEIAQVKVSDNCIHEVDILDVGVSEKEKSGVTGEPMEEDDVEEIVRSSLPPFEHTVSEIKLKTSAHTKHHDRYEAIEEVERLPGAEKALKRARPMAPAIQQIRVDWEINTGPSPTLTMLTTDLNERHYAPSPPRPKSPPPPHHSPPPFKRYRPDPDIILRSYSPRQQQQLDKLEKLICKNFNDTGKKMLSAIDKEVRPEMLGELFSSVNASKKNMDMLKEVMKFWEPQFSTEEKERFLKSVGRRVSAFSMVTWCDMVRYNKFDALMFITRNRGERKDAIRRNLCRINGDLDDALQQLLKWREYGPREILTILRTSKFISPALEGLLYSFVQPDCFEEAMKVICRYFWRPFPKPLFLALFPGNMLGLVNASRQWRMCERTVVRLVKWFVGEDEWLKEAAGIVLKENAWADLIWDKEEKYASTTLPCWERKNAMHSEEFQMERVDENNAALASRRLREEQGPVTISYRLLNDPRFPKSLSAIMWQLPNSNKKRFMPVSRDLGGPELEVMNDLLLSDLVLIDLCNFGEAVGNCLHRSPSTERIAKGTLKGGRGHILQRLAKERKMSACLATSSRPIVDERDIDECFLWHMAHELDLLMKRK